MTQIEEGRRIEDAAARLNRSLLTLSRCNRVLWQARDEQELLRSICQILVETAGVRLAWIGYCEDDAEKTVRPVARAGNGLDFLERVEISWGHSDAGQGPVGRAIRTGKFCRVDDVPAEPRLSHGRTEAMALGYVSCVALPLVADVGPQGRLDLRGALTLYADAFDGSEIERYEDLASYFTCAVARLRRNLADDVAHGVSTLRTREDRKRAEEALRERAQLLDLTHDTIFVRDMHDIITFWNRGAEELYGWKSEQAVGKLSHQLTQTIFPTRLEEINAELLRTGRWDGELVHTKRDGTQVAVASRWALRRDEHGIPTAILETNNDITERKRAQYLTGHVFESSPDSISIIGRDYRFQRVNPVYERFWGMPAERMVGMHVADLVGSDVFEHRGKPNLDRCFAGEEVSFAEWFATPRGRKYRAMSYSPLRPDSQRVEAALMIARDLTEHMLGSEALREAQMQLAHVNRVTTMGQLAASIAHEVNQPVAATVANADAGLLWLGARPPNLQEVRQSLEDIIKDGHRAGKVIDRIRALVKKVPPRNDQLDINEIVLEVIALTRSEVLRNGVSLQTQLADGLPLVQGDRIQLQQVMLNLIVNAVEAMSGAGEGARELLISTGKDASNAVLVAVRDSGPGLDPEGLGRLFDAFYTTKPGGMGMGLSICRSILEAHGGRIWATANVPQGAVFQFTLPVGESNTNLKCN
jgi:PAS domain S-box-containing protein